MKKFILLKLTGLALGVMAILVLLSFIEVAIYSYLIRPGQDEQVYEAHAMMTAPYISAVFGFIFFLLITRYWTKKGLENVSRLSILFPFTYVMIDYFILLAAGVNWSEFYLIFLLANGAKFLGSYLGYRLNRLQS